MQKQKSDLTKDEINMVSRFLKKLIGDAKPSLTRKKYSAWRQKMMAITAATNEKREPLWDSSQGPYMRAKHGPLRKVMK